MADSSCCSHDSGPLIAPVSSSFSTSSSVLQPFAPAALPAFFAAAASAFPSSHSDGRRLPGKVQNLSPGAIRLYPMRIDDSRASLFVAVCRPHRPHCQFVFLRSIAMRQQLCCALLAMVWPAVPPRPVAPGYRFRPPFQARSRNHKRPRTRPLPSGRIRVACGIAEGALTRDAPTSFPYHRQKPSPGLRERRFCNHLRPHARPGLSGSQGRVCRQRPQPAGFNPRAGVREEKTDLAAACAAFELKLRPERRQLLFVRVPVPAQRFFELERHHPQHDAAGGRDRRGRGPLLSSIL